MVSGNRTFGEGKVKKKQHHIARQPDIVSPLAVCPKVLTQLGVKLKNIYTKKLLCFASCHPQKLLHTSANHQQARLQHGERSAVRRAEARRRVMRSRGGTG